MAGLRKYKSLYSSTANSFGTGEAVTITPASVVGLPTGNITLTFDRVDSSGTATPSKMERILGSVSGSNFVVASGGRGYDGTTEQAHTSPVVEMIWNAKDWNDAVDALTNVVSATTGALDTTKVVDLTTAQTLTTKTLTSPKVGTSILDTNGNELFKVTATTSAINEVTVANGAANNGPTLSATGDDTNIDINITPKGTGTTTTPKMQGASSNAQFPQFIGEYNNGNSGTSKAIDWSKGDRQKVTITGDGCAFTFSNAVAGQTLTLRVVEDASGHTAHTWPTLKWPGGTVGTPTLTANAINLYIFYFDGTNYLTQLSAGFA